MSFLEEEPRGDATTKWWGGILAPLPFAIYGLLCVFNRVGTLPGKSRDRDHLLLLGSDAIILGIVCLIFAAILHFHYFWGLSENERMKENYEYGKVISLWVLIPSLAWVAWCFLRGFGELY